MAGPYVAAKVRRESMFEQNMGDIVPHKACCYVGWWIGDIELSHM